ncbi:Glutamyl-tRNA Gln amidotransferase subunit B mitochondrial [Taenia crassiceps]|uniref:Glutamyl-tRNA Gln amidotransferase subunit B mitochondrial n=1 Tax=Taenia crassiceps TaxID=6207 RepID=A0ABR4QM27_9CEST
MKSLLTETTCKCSDYLTRCNVHSHFTLPQRQHVFPLSVAPFDAALPGSMPILNRDCVVWAVVAALALNCRINPLSRFDRKHYFYADLPAGFQITQHSHPIAEDGWLEYVWKLPAINSPPQDTGKSLHDEKNRRSLIDLNRAGVALIEIVTDPDFGTSYQAAAFVDELATLLHHIRVCSANMSTGEMRVDINVSVGPSTSQQGSVVEVKNVNSLRAIRHAIDYEISRQCRIFRSGGTIINETRSFDPISNKTIQVRDKEVVQDYRFLPEPNLPPLRILESCEACSSMKTPSLPRKICIGCIRLQHEADIIRLPNQLRQNLVFQHGLPLERASPLVEKPQLRSLYLSTSALILSQLSSFEEQIVAVQGVSGNELEKIVYRETAFWCSGLLYSIFRDTPDLCLPSPVQLSQFVVMTLSGQIFGTGAEQVLNDLCAEGASADALEIAGRIGVLLDHDLAQIRSICVHFIESNPALVLKYIRKGRKRRLLQLMASRIVHSSEGTQLLHAGLVERCLSDLLDRVKDDGTLVK